MKLYMFRRVPVSIIRSFSLYTQQWYMSYRFADSLRAGSGWKKVQNQLDAPISQIYSLNETLHVSDSSSFHHQEFFTVHTSVVYVIQFCRQLASSKLAAKLYDIRRQFQNQLPIGWLKKYKIENKTLLYGTVTYITALLLHIVANHILALVILWH
jgi:hypothetical protein